MASQNFPSSFDEQQKEEYVLVYPLTFHKSLLTHSVNSSKNVVDKFIEKCKEQPLVPLGVFATIGAVAMAARGLKRGDKHDANRWFRRRVLFQGLTIVALVGGSFVYDQAKISQKSEEDLAREKAKIREQLWINELERRDEEMKQRKLRAQLAKKAREEAEKNLD